jgi:hypothetical protein
MDRLLVAEGMATITIFDVSGMPRIELTSTACVMPNVAEVQSALSSRRLPEDIRQLSDDVRRALIADHVLMESARQISIEIRLRGSRPSFDINYRARKA